MILNLRNFDCNVGHAADSHVHDFVFHFTGALIKIKSDPTWSIFITNLSVFSEKGLRIVSNETMSMCVQQKTSLCIWIFDIPIVGIKNNQIILAHIRTDWVNQMS